MKKTKKKAQSVVARTFAETPRGALHAALGIPRKRRIPLSKLREAAKWTGKRAKLGAKAACALHVRLKREESR